MLSSTLQLYKNSFSGLSKDIWWLSLVTLINRTGTVVILFLSIYLTEQLHFTKMETSYALTSWGVGSLLGSYLGGFLSDRFGYYRVMFWSLLLVGIGFLLLMFVKTVFGFCLGILIVTTIGDTFRPASQASISAYSLPENHTRSLSLYRMAINFGFAIGAGGAGLLAGAFGYHWLFIIDGSTCILASFVFLKTLQEKKEVVEEKEKKAEHKTIPKTQRSAYQDYWYLIFLVFLLFNAISFFQLFETFPVFCREELLMSELEIGLLMTFNGLLICALEMPMIYILTKKNREMELIIWGVAFIGVSYLMFNLLGFHLWVGYLMMVFLTIGEIINFPIANTLALKRSTPNTRGQFMGAFSMMFSMAAIFAPLIGFFIVDKYSFVHLWNFTGLLCAISVLGLFFLKKIRTHKEVVQKLSR